MEPQRLLPGDSTLVENIVNYLKAKGIFDEFRHECLADVDTKSSCQNLSQRVDGYAAKFLANETWHPDLNKNELRNKLRRHIDESGMLAVGADHVVEQVINPKIHQLFLPRIIEVVHQYMKEQNEILNKKPETSPGDSALSENASDTSDSSKTKASISDPIADILSFSYSKTKPTPASTTHGKTDSIVQKHADLIKGEKKKDDKTTAVLEKNILESPSENLSTPLVAEVKPQPEKEKDKKKDEPEVPLEATKKVVKEEIKIEKKKVEDGKLQISEINTPVEENKSGTPLSGKPNISGKKEVDKNKQKSKSISTQKPSSTSSEVKKPKKEPLDKSLEKQAKSKLLKPAKESPSPTKSVSSVKSVSKDEKGGEISKSKSSDSTSSKTSEMSLKKSSKSNSNKTDPSNSKHKGQDEKSERNKISKSSDKNEQNLHESANSEKGTKNIHYSSSYDSSQGSDQEKSSSSSSKKERQKYFSKHTKKESSDTHCDTSSKASSYKRRSKDADGTHFKQQKGEKNAAHEKSKETITVGEAAKISSRSNSFGSTSSVGSSSNTSKDNLVLNSDEALEGSKKDKKKKQMKEKEPCHISKEFPPPPPPPPPSSSLSCELTSSAEVSSIEEDTQSSSSSGNSSSEELSEQSSNDSEVEAKESVHNTLNENLLNSSTDDINEFYDIFLYSSSSSEFEGFGDSPERKRTEDVLEKINESDISVSSVHTSDLSSYDDELSDDDLFFNDESQTGVRKRLTLKEAQELMQRRKAFLQTCDEKKIPVANKSDENSLSFNKGCVERSSSLLSSEDESLPAEPKRSLRRERKLNPRYASSEYTSIFNSRKETFITKQSSPYGKNQTPNSSPVIETKCKKESVVEKDKSLKKNPAETRIVKVHQDNVGRSRKTKRKVYASQNLEEDKELSDSSEISSSDEIDSIMDKEKVFLENDKSNVSVSDQLKLQFKFKAQSITNHTVNSYPVKRKLKDAESCPSKRPCSRGSVDSSSSECVPNENKPFNCEKHDLSEEKSIRDGGFKGSDLFCKQRTNNNGDILGQKDIYPKSSHGKAISTPERKSSETENSKELSAL